MQNPKMTIADIYREADILTDDSIDNYTKRIYLNQGIMRLNNDCALKLPRVSDVDTPNIYDVSEDEFVNDLVSNILTHWVAYSIKQTEGYQNAENTFYSSFLANETQFRAKFRHLIKEEYQLTPYQNGETKPGKFTNQLPFMHKGRMW